MVPMTQQPKKEMMGREDLAKQATALDDDTQKKKAGISLDDLARQAAALDDN